MKILARKCPLLVLSIQLLVALLTFHASGWWPVCVETKVIRFKPREIDYSTLREKSVSLIEPVVLQAAPAIDDERNSTVFRFQFNTAINTYHVDLINTDWRITKFEENKFSRPFGPPSMFQGSAIPSELTPGGQNVESDYMFDVHRNLTEANVKTNGSKANANQRLTPSYATDALSDSKLKDLGCATSSFTAYENFFNPSDKRNYTIGADQAGFCLIRYKNSSQPLPTERSLQYDLENLDTWYWFPFSWSQRYRVSAIISHVGPETHAVRRSGPDIVAREKRKVSSEYGFLRLLTIDETGGLYIQDMQFEGPSQGNYKTTLEFELLPRSGHYKLGSLNLAMYNPRPDNLFATVPQLETLLANRVGFDQMRRSYARSHIEAIFMWRGTLCWAQGLNSRTYDNRTLDCIRTNPNTSLPSDLDGPKPYNHLSSYLAIEVMDLKRNTVYHIVRISDGKTINNDNDNEYEDKDKDEDEAKQNEKEFINRPVYYYCRHPTNAQQPVVLNYANFSDQAASKCKRKALSRVPIDIVAWRWMGCQKLIAFYPQMYQLHDIADSIDMPAKLNYASWMRFTPRAVLVQRDRFYFFLGGNALTSLRFNYISCSEIIPIEGSKIDMYASELLRDFGANWALPGQGDVPERRIRRSNRMQPRKEPQVNFGPAPILYTGFTELFNGKFIPSLKFKPDDMPNETKLVPYPDEPSDDGQFWVFIAGIVLGFLLAALLIYCLFRRRKRKSESDINTELGEPRHNLLDAKRVTSDDFVGVGEPIKPNVARNRSPKTSPWGARTTRSVLKDPGSPTSLGSGSPRLVVSVAERTPRSGLSSPTSLGVRASQSPVSTDARITTDDQSSALVVRDPSPASSQSRSQAQKNINKAIVESMLRSRASRSRSASKKARSGAAPSHPSSGQHSRPTGASNKITLGKGGGKAAPGASSGRPRSLTSKASQRTDGSMASIMSKKSKTSSKQSKTAAKTGAVGWSSRKRKRKSGKKSHQAKKTSGSKKK